MQFVVGGLVYDDYDDEHLICDNEVLCILLCTCRRALVFVFTIFRFVVGFSIRFCILILVFF